MPSHPHRNWQRRWTLEDEGFRARHDSGAVAHYRKLDGVAEFLTLEDPPEPAPGYLASRLRWEAAELVRRQPPERQPAGTETAAGPRP